VASFVKKIARLSLFAPPAATITVVPFCYNLIKLHPTVMALLHRLPDPNSKSLKALPTNGKLLFIPSFFPLQSTDLL
jgi:U3 small nucleolar RNA-associated protein 19